MAGLFGEQEEPRTDSLHLLLTPAHDGVSSHPCLSQDPPPAEPDLAPCSSSSSPSSSLSSLTLIFPSLLPSSPHLSLTTHSILPGCFYFTYVWLSLLPEQIPRFSLTTIPASKKCSALSKWDLKRCCYIYTWKSSDICSSGPCLLSIFKLFLSTNVSLQISFFFTTE